MIGLIPGVWNCLPAFGTRGGRERIKLLFTTRACTAFEDTLVFFFLHSKNRSFAHSKGSTVHSLANLSTDLSFIAGPCTLRDDSRFRRHSRTACSFEAAALSADRPDAVQLSSRVRSRATSTRGFNYNSSLSPLVRARASRVSSIGRPCFVRLIWYRENELWNPLQRARFPAERTVYVICVYPR